MSNDERRRARAERARKKRRRRNIILGSILTAVFLIVGVVLCLTVFFHIASIEVTGDEIYNPGQIIEASGIQIGENLFLVSAKDAAAEIERALPYVESAQIKRSLSCKVTIQVTAATAAAALDNGESYTLLNASGKVLEDGVMTINDGMILITAGEVSAAVPGELAVFAADGAFEDTVFALKAFSDAGLVGITELDVRDSTNIKARYKDRILLELGAASTIPDKTDFIKATLERSEISSPEFKGTIDFTIDKKAYQNAEDATTAPAESTSASQPEEGSTQETASTSAAA